MISDTMATGEFTRGSAGAADPRGGSMVRERKE